MKWAAESALAASGIPATVVRATAFLEWWIELLGHTARGRNRPIIFGRGQNPINFVSVRDVAALVERVVVDPATRGQTLEIGGPQSISFNELARLVAANLGTPAEPRHVPRAGLYAMAATVGRIRPAIGRQIWSALAMDRADMTFDAAQGRARFPGLPCTSVNELLR